MIDFVNLYQRFLAVFVECLVFVTGHFLKKLEEIDPSLPCYQEIATPLNLFRKAFRGLRL